MPHSIQRQFDYNLWANTQLTKTLQPVDDAILNAVMKSSFPGIAKTLLHIWDAEVIWLKRLQGESLTNWPSASFSGNKEDMLNGFLESSRALTALVNAKDKAFLSGTIRYQNTKGRTYETGVEGLLFHVVNHGTYHRGQMVTLLREAGISNILGMDLIAYLRL